MRIGPLNKRVTIQTATESRDSHGDVAQTWATHATVWAAIEPLSGSERIVAQQAEAFTTHRVRIRYLSTVTSDMRVLYGTRYFNIESVLNIDERGEEMHLLCQEAA